MENKYKNFTTLELLIIDSVRDYHDPELEREICDRAGLLAEFDSADGETFEGVFDRAVEKLENEKATWDVEQSQLVSIFNKYL
jgi:hypothetical protein